MTLTRLQPWPFHPNKDAVAQEAFKKNFASLTQDVLPSTAKNRPLEVWFKDG